MAFAYGSPVTVNTGQCPSTQSNFPWLVSQIDPRFRSVGNGGHVQSASGFDIRPMAAPNLTGPLIYELERYNPVTGEVIMWVNTPTVSDNLEIFLGYGDPTLSTDGSNGPGTFSNNFWGVYHFKDGTTLNVTDATTIHNGTNNAGATATPGQIDGAVNLVAASSQYISTPSTGFASSAITLSAWVDAASFPGAQNDVGGRNGQRQILAVNSSGKLACFVYNGSATISYNGTGSHTLLPGTWYYLVMTYDSVTGLNGYVNAALDATVAPNGNPVGDVATMNIGYDTLSGNPWNGKIDEFRVSTVVRSHDWITIEYNTSFPATFETLGAEFTLGGGGGGGGGLINCGSKRRQGDRNLFGGDRNIMDRAIGCNRRGDRGQR